MRISVSEDTMTKVVHVREKFDVYIGRANGRTRGARDGYFGNPFIIGNDGTRTDVIAKYKIYFYKRIQDTPEFKRRIHELLDKTLGCYCHPLACHGDIIAEYLETIVRQK